MGKGPGKSHTVTASLQPGPVGEKAPRRISPEFVPAPGSQPLPSLHLANMFIFPSPSLPPSLPHHPLLIHLFHSLVSFSHFFDCPTPSHSDPLTDHLSVGACTDGLFPRAAGLNQLQLEMQAGGGGGATLAGGRAEI